ncbi:phosphoribosyltransferase [Actinomycetota bacterium]
MDGVRPFRDRHRAGEALGRTLVDSGWDGIDPLVLALPRGGVPVAVGVAKALDAPFDVFVVRKLGVPGHAELAMGAIASGGIRYVDGATIRALGIAPEAVADVEDRERRELARRERRYRGDRPYPSIAGSDVVIVDDGIATGASMQVAVDAIRSHGPSSVTIAVPVAPVGAAELFGDRIDAFVTCATPEPFLAVGYWYEDFDQTSDDEVIAALHLP